MTKAMEKASASAPIDVERMVDVWKRASGGDASTLNEVRSLLANRDIPGLVRLWGGELAATAELSLVQAMAGKDLAAREAITRKLALLRAELAGPNPTPLECLLAERAVACWLQVQDADLRYAQGQRDCSFAEGDYQQRRQDRAHKRYLLAIRTLAFVRKLALPVLQVNIARKQVNVAGMAEQQVAI